MTLPHRLLSQSLRFKAEFQTLSVTQLLVSVLLMIRTFQTDGSDVAEIAGQRISQAVVLVVLVVDAILNDYI
jgi:hypothetical protein